VKNIGVINYLLSHTNLASSEVDSLLLHLKEVSGRYCLSKALIANRIVAEAKMLLQHC
jgi:hypothetical protein